MSSKWVFDRKWSKMKPQIRQNEQVFDQKKSDFWGHFSTFKAQTTTKSRSFKVEHDA